MNTIIENLNWRYATKTFDPSKTISQADLDTIIESFRLTASSFGLQPWKLFIVEDPQTRQALLENSWYQKQVVDSAYHLVFARSTASGETLVQEFVDDTVRTREIPTESLEDYKQIMLGFLSRLSEPEQATWAEKQVYIALGNVMTVLAELKIDSCPMEGIQPAKYDEILGLTDQGFATVVALPIGYRKDDDKYASMKKVRFSREKISKLI